MHRKFSEDEILEKLEQLCCDSIYESDYEDQYREELDEVYSFSAVGGPFSYFLPSVVLETLDPIAYNVGLSDFFDSLMGENAIEIGGEFYSREDYETAIEELEDESEK